MSRSPLLMLFDVSAGAAPASLTWLLHVTWATDDDAPVTTPYAGEVGSVAITQVENQLAVSGGMLSALGGGAGVNYQDEMVRNADPASFARADGLAIYTRMRRTANDAYYVGLIQPNDFSVPSAVTEARIFHSGSTMYVYSNGFKPGPMESDTLDVWHDYVIVFRNGGGSFLFRDGELLWVDVDGATDPIYTNLFAHKASDGDGDCDECGVLNLVTNGLTEYSDPYQLSMQRLVSPIVNDTATNTAGNVLAFLRNVTVPTAGSIQVDFRIAGTDEVSLTIASDGTAAMAENGTARITGAAGNVTTGDDICLSLRGSTARLFASSGDFTATGTYASLAVLTGTGSKVVDLGTGGAIGSIEIYDVDQSAHLPTELGGSA